MDSTLAYSIAVGIAIVFLFFLAKFALRWFIRIAIIVIILLALAGAAWVWLNSSSSSTDKKPRSTLTPGNVRYVLACGGLEIREPLFESRQSRASRTLISTDRQ
jgi:energy-coupling factor transporter transmembrane protein EcfT